MRVQGRLRLRIVGVNDVYSLEQLPRLASLVRAASVEDPADALLVTVAGDFLAPSLLSSLDEGRGMTDCFRALGVTHVTLGNHEDDLPIEALALRLSQLAAKVLLTNVTDFRGDFVRSDVVRIRDREVGLVGGLSGERGLYRRPPFGGATIGPLEEALVGEAGRLRAGGCTAIVAITHQSLGEDRELADLGVVDLILGGHEHGGHLEVDRRAPLAKAPMNAHAAVVANLTFEGSAARPVVDVHLVPVADFPEDPAMRARVDGHLQAVRALEARTLLTLAEGEVLSSRRSRFAQSSFGTFVCSRLRDALGAEAALFNGGGLRGETEHRDRLTYADLRDELPFDNEIVVARLPGRVVREAVRFARTRRLGTGGYLQVDDAAVVDEAGELSGLAGRPLDPDRAYEVALPRELLLGLDDLTPLVELARAHPEVVPGKTTGMAVLVALIAALSGATAG